MNCYIILVNIERLVEAMTQMKDNSKQNIGLTARQKEILLLLTKFDGTNPVTVSAISEKFRLSTRTVLRELPQIERWVSAQGFSFVRKPGVGLLLDESLENRQWLAQLLQMEEVEQSYGKDERRKLILGELLSAKEPLKFLYFTSKYKISEGTLSSDLDFVEDWLLQYKNQLVRKPGVGVFVRGREEDIRQAVANAVYEFMKEDEILALLKTNVGDKTEKKPAENMFHSHLGQFVDSDNIKLVEHVLEEVEEKFQIHYSDSGYMAMIVHLSLAVGRIQKKEKITMNETELTELQRVAEYSIAEEIGRRLEEIFFLEVPEDELGFITMHLVGSEIWAHEEEVEIRWNQVHIKRLALGIVALVEKELRADLQKDELLVMDLCKCIEPALRRLTMGIYIRNAYVKEVRQTYKEIYEATENACSLLLIAAGVDRIPETEVGLLAMNFCAAVERAKFKGTEIAVAIVCPTGIGTSRMLEVSLENNFPELRVVDILSARQINKERLRDAEFDLVISTVHLDLDFPCVSVSPMLLEQDKLLLKHKLAEIRVQNKVSGKVKTERNISKDIIKDVAELGQGILRLLETIVVYPIHSVSYKRELIAKAAYMFAENVEMEAVIQSDLLNREKISETYIEEYNLLLLHCATDGVTSARFGYIRMTHSLYADGREIGGAMVMLVPKKDNKSCVEIMGHISTLLMESPRLYVTLKEKEEKEVIALLELELGKYYKRQVKKRMEW